MSETATQEQTKTSPWAAIDPAALNGAGLYSEKVVINPTADAFAKAPPVDDGKYIFLLGPSAKPEVPTLEGRVLPANGDKPAANLIRVNCSLTIVSRADGTTNGLEGKIKRFDKSFSANSRNKGGVMVNEVATLLGYLGIGNIPAEVSNEVLAGTLNQILMTGQAQIGGATVWRGGFTKKKLANGEDDPKDFGKWTIQGQRNFPLAPGGAPGVGPFSTTAFVDGKEIFAKAYLRDDGFFSLTQPAVAK